MLQENKIIELLPQVLSGDRLIEELGYLPAYNETIIEQSQASRLLALSDIYRVYVPSEMSIEIYNKLYLALLLSIKKKFTAAAVKQRYENAKMIKRMDSVGIIGGSDSFTIIGSSGIGKSSAIEKSIGLLTENAIIQDDELIGDVIPCLVVQCPFDSSVKSLLLEILRKTDEVLETNYYESAKKSRYTTTDVYHAKGRPMKVSALKVCKRVGITHTLIKFMPLCKACIDEYAETDDEYHARIIVWAYRKLKAEKTDGEIIRVSEIHKLTSEWKENIIRALPYMTKFADQEMINEIDALAREKHWHRNLVD